MAGTGLHPDRMSRSRNRHTLLKKAWWVLVVLCLEFETLQRKWKDWKWKDWWKKKIARLRAYRYLTFHFFLDSFGCSSPVQTRVPRGGHNLQRKHFSFLKEIHANCVPGIRREFCTAMGKNGSVPSIRASRPVTGHQHPLGARRARATRRHIIACN